MVIPTNPSFFFFAPGGQPFSYQRPLGYFINGSKIIMLHDQIYEEGHWGSVSKSCKTSSTGHSMQCTSCIIKDGKISEWITSQIESKNSNLRLNFISQGSYTLITLKFHEFSITFSSSNYDYNLRLNTLAPVTKSAMQNAINTQSQSSQNSMTFEWLQIISTKGCDV